MDLRGSYAASRLGGLLSWGTGGYGSWGGETWGASSGDTLTRPDDAPEPDEYLTGDGEELVRRGLKGLGKGQRRKGRTRRLKRSTSSSRRPSSRHRRRKKPAQHTRGRSSGSSSSSSGKRRRVMTLPSGKRVVEAEEEVTDEDGEEVYDDELYLEDEPDYTILYVLGGIAVLGIGAYVITTRKGKKA